MLASVIDRGETKARRKHVIPDPVTTPRRGPLWLRGRRCREETRGRSRNSRSQLADVSRAPVLPRKSANTSLNRLPVVMIQRPLDHIEATLGGLSCCLLQERVAVMELPCDVKTVKLPHLHPMMKYSPINNGIRGNAWQQKCHTQEEGNVGVSITYSKHPPPSLLSPSSPDPQSSGKRQVYLIPGTQHTELPTSSLTPHTLPQLPTSSHLHRDI
ncbi:hypothetical protein GBAR_LOCUS9947 [Geodia barretti]|uniref:Uncharacterized protein n=1 Tax=Geodia barretti TaxID=519541 RepID=A0AA35WJM4_GEOBA|nr:hypothetical protein GBAR_LOCUS9947 [Geodia barretti]